ncbi:MAG: hypothetical protein MUF00_02635 [Gemmatimonadaceae bacterium]|nr:hypothetical protein [Gemmatimonadaceae bacterium]
MTLASLAACAREQPPKAPRVDSVVQAPAPPPPVVVDWRGWDERVGGLLAVAPEDDPDLAFLVRPDATTADVADSVWHTRVSAGDSVELFALDGSRHRVQIVALPVTTGGAACEEWPAARISNAPRSWGVGFVLDRAHPVPAVAVESLRGTDSSAAVSLAARIAQATPAARASGLAGMPFIVERLHRASLAVSSTEQAAQSFGDTTIIAATLFRRLAQEADPREERWFVLAERTGRAKSAPWVVRYLEYDDAPEDEADAMALLGLVRVRASGQPAMLIARDGRDGLVLKWIAPARDGAWRVTWTSARARCRAR